MPRTSGHTDSQVLALLSLLAATGSSEQTAARANADGLQPPISPRTLRHWRTTTHAQAYQQLHNRVQQWRDTIDHIREVERRLRRLQRRIDTVHDRLEPTTALIRLTDYEHKQQRLEHEIERLRATLPTGAETLLNVSPPQIAAGNVCARVDA